MNPFTVHEQRMFGVIGLALFGLVVVTVAAFAAWDEFAAYRTHRGRCRVPGCIECGGPS